MSTGHLLVVYSTNLVFVKEWEEDRSSQKKVRGGQRKPTVREKIFLAYILNSMLSGKQTKATSEHTIPTLRRTFLKT